MNSETDVYPQSDCKNEVPAEQKVYPCTSESNMISVPSDRFSTARQPARNSYNLLISYTYKNREVFTDPEDYRENKIERQALRPEFGDI